MKYKQYSLKYIQNPKKLSGSVQFTNINEIWQNTTFEFNSPFF